MSIFAVEAKGTTSTPTTQPAPTNRATSTPIPSPQPTGTMAVYGPSPAQFPSNINPLTGMPVADPSLLKIPAMLISISHFPAVGRPQAGLSYAPFVYEFSITGGETRFLAAFYGEFPAVDVPISGNCAVRTGVFDGRGTLMGNLVWLDSNRNGIQDPGERGIPGICVRLEDGSGNLLQSTSTDTNGVYGFSIPADGNFILKFSRPDYLEFTKSNIGPEERDSDADPSTGQIAVENPQESNLNLDVGMFPSQSYAEPTSKADGIPKPEVGPVRSGRLLYAYLGGSYQDSCLVYAFASPEVLPKIPHCSFVAHEEANGGEMLSIERMRAIAEDNMRHTASRPFNYTSNRYSPLPPPGGVPGGEIHVFFGNLNQSGWTYDPLYQSYLRFVDSADVTARGVLHADVDRLTRRQIHFENIVVVMADTDVVSPTNIDIHLDEGNSGPAWLFRGGRAYKISWSTRADEYEKESGFRRPIRFLNPDASPAALMPGHTWVIIVTPFSTVQPESHGAFQVKYEAPAGEAR
jgi:hypothetical protein